MGVKDKACPVHQGRTPLGKRLACRGSIFGFVGRLLRQSLPHGRPAGNHLQEPPAGWAAARQAGGKVVPAESGFKVQRP